MFSQILGHFMAQWSWHTKLTIIDLSCSDHWVYIFAANGIWITLERIKENQNYTDFFLLEDSRHLSFWYLFHQSYVHQRPRRTVLSYENDSERNQCAVYNVVFTAFYPISFFWHCWVRYPFLHLASIEIQITMVPSNFRQSIDNCRHIRR